MYSDAPRCRPCDMKASLNEVGATSLEKASRRGLVAYPCPVDQGWHVRLNPADR